MMMMVHWTGQCAAEYNRFEAHPRGDRERDALLGVDPLNHGRCGPHPLSGDRRQQ